MSTACFKVPQPYNEPVLSYAPGTPERQALKAKLAELASNPIEVPLFIGGREIKTGRLAEIRSPHNHALKLGVYHQAGESEVALAIESALAAQKTWAALPWEQRVSIFLKAADLLAGPWRFTMNAATMLGQSKTAYQSEIDAVCETADFWRYNATYLAQLAGDQPYSPPGVWNRVEYRPLEGFVFAVTPFNFTSIAANLPTAPALAGNVVLWKPASSAVYSAWYVLQLLREAGLPAGVINFIPGPGGQVGNPVLNSPELAGIHFTGSNTVFNEMWKAVAQTIERRKYYPRIVGETGGKDFIFAHASAQVEPLVANTIRGAFEYQGQKCSAASRLYLPASLWPAFEARYVAETAKIKVGDPADFGNFMGAVIDRGAFKNITAYIDYAKNAADARILTGGGYDDSRGYFIEPTTIVTTNPKFKTMEEEIFGPVLTVYVYDDDKLDEALDLCANTSVYGLTGAVWGQDRQALAKMTQALTNAAGNFYINDKPTGAVVGQQPFGGSRASGTNDKAGSAINLLRWLSLRTIKETMVPPARWEYPFMQGE